MSKLGEIIGLNASKAKFIVGQAPDAAAGGSVFRLQPALSSAGKHIDLNGEGAIQLVDDLIIQLAGKDLFQVPKSLTLDMTSAAQWYRGQMDKLVQMIDKTAPLQVQMAQAEKIQNVLLQAAEHSLADPALAATLREAFVRLDVPDLMVKYASEGLSGKALQEKVLAELTKPVDTKRRWFEPGACFAAGTLVHTREGLKPIEQIKVGDYVLSKPENGGEQAYKRVLKTFAHPPQRVVRVECEMPPQQDEFCVGAWPKGRKDATGKLTRYAPPLLVTFNHPFWTKEEGWTSPSHMQNQGSRLFNFEDVRGDSVHCWGIRNIYISDRLNIGWTPYGSDVLTDQMGFLWDYVDCKLIDEDAKAIESVEYLYDLDTFFKREKEDALGIVIEDITNQDFIDSDIFFKLPVYNLEVEDFHTYYVGEHGIWVHNINCNGLNFEVRNTTNGNGLKLNPAHPNFLTRPELTNWLKTNNKTDGVYRLRASEQSQFNLIEPTDRKNWLKFEQGVTGRLESNNKDIWEYAAPFWDSQKQELGILGVEGAEMVNGAINFIDRKLAWTKAGKTEEIMQSLRRISERLKQNPTETWTFEFNLGIRRPDLIAKRRADEMFVNIVAGDPALQITKKVDGIEVVDEEAMALLRSLIESNRIKTRNTDVPMRFPQSIFEEGPGLSIPDLELGYVYLQLSQARQYWLNQGASPSRLSQASFAIADLPTGWAARTEGTQITLDASGAGWGWFVDPSPENNTEFVSASTDPGEQALLMDYTALPGSEADGRLDLLTVLIHELGHVLGIPMPQAAAGEDGMNHVMSQYLEPGQRRLPDAVDIAALQILGWDAYTGNLAPIGGGPVGTPVAPAPTPTALDLGVVNPTLLNGDFGSANTADWLAEGNVTGNAITLAETSLVQTRLTQAFMVNEGDHSLSFTISDQRFTANSSNGPSDAFEVVLLDANTGLPVTDSMRQ
ncbi:MAG: hypothetical protein LBE62_16015 [Azonexus sp.]|jgi:hypothetical protein|nr:hypothetical protein [Azonexus sp.]